MRQIPALLAAACLLSHCVPPPDPSPPVFYPLSVTEDDKGAADQPPAQPPSVVTAEHQGIRLEGVGFDSRSHRLVVVDQAGGPGSEFADPQAAAATRDGIAAINGGFFTPEGTPLGLVVANGSVAGKWNSRSSVCNGLFYEIAATKPRLARREALDPDEAMDMSELLQTGPVLVDGHTAVTGLDDSRQRPRTLLAWDGGHRWWMGRTSPCTLQALAHALKSAPPCDWPIHHALNLDGGTSSSLWVSRSVIGGPLSSQRWLVKPARNYLVLTTR